MSYLVSARKYRPTKFDNVVGQKHVTTTLKNAIKNNKIGHAYLFCGPRGVGKTTCARIFASTVNENSNSQYNIFELDAASNNGVEHIRNLIEQIKVPPQVGRYKVYIIDEVHMLSDAAFNAFLKTLEEPPKHSIFILATTEKNKLIPTILSRCQIFDFKKISNEDISEYLKLIANHKEINVCNKTLEIIANKADGSLRDALSIFDKISSHFEENWNYNDALRLMSTLDSSFSSELTRSILDNDISNCILQIDRVISEGYNPKEILKNTTSHFRNLILAKDASTFGLINERTDLKNIIKEQSDSISKNKIIDSLVCLDKCSQQLRNSINKRFDVELCVLKLCAMNSDEKKKIIEKSNTKELNPNNQKKTDILKEQEFDNNPIATKDKKDEKNLQAELTENKIIKTDKSIENFQPSVESEIISISEELNQNTKLVEKIETNKKSDDWTEQELLDQWKSFIKTLMSQKKTSAYNVFQRTTPKKNNNVVEIEFYSLSEKFEFEELKSNLLEYLRLRLSNSELEISLIAKIQEGNDVAITKKDKYELLLTKNKKLSKLIDKLELNSI